jgi:DNA-binding transcriptional LysR family regulator
MFFFCAAGHPLAGKAQIAFEDLLEFPWVGPTLPGRIRAILPTAGKPFAVLDGAQNRLHPRALVGSFSAAKQIVLAGHALGAAIPSQIARELSEGLCVRLPIDTPWLGLNYGFITKRGRTLSPAAKAFMELVRAVELDIPRQFARVARANRRRWEGHTR